VARRWSSFVVRVGLQVGFLFVSTAALAQGAAPPPEKHGFLGMFYVGGHHYFGNAGKNLGTGLRLGTILGGRLTPQISLNGEITLDVLNPKNVPPGVDASGIDADITFSPLFHVPSGNVEIVVGPKLGLRAAAQNVTSGGFRTTSSTSGYTAGINAGVFFALSPGASLGALLNFEARTHDESCAQGSGFPEVCTTQNQPAADKVMGINIAVLL
jgi:hypothetical protein